ncbi:MAG: HTH domain-containing protein [Rhodothermales bacterium]
MPSSSPVTPISSNTRCGTTSEERAHHLIEWLRSGEKLTSATAAEVFGVSRRTITRDIAYLRNALSLDIEFDASLNSYVLASEHTALPFLAFPSLAPILLNAETEPGLGGADPSKQIHVRYSAVAIQAFLARGGNLTNGTANADGTLDAYFPPYKLDEFMSYVLSRGHHIEVLEPFDFRHRVHMEIRRMLSIYEGKDGRCA